LSESGCAWRVAVDARYRQHCLTLLLARGNGPPNDQAKKLQLIGGSDDPLVKAEELLLTESLQEQFNESSTRKSGSRPARRRRETDSNRRSPHEKGLVWRSSRSTAWAKPTIGLRDDPSRWLPLADDKPTAVERVEQFQQCLATRPLAEYRVLGRSSLEPERLHDA
jgi:hypothetical protein